MRCFLTQQLFCRSSKRKPSDNVSVGSQKRRDLSHSYVEHYLSLEELCDIYQDSFIDAAQPDQSDGLSCLEAQKRLQDGGLNVMQKSAEPSRIRLLINQHFYQFWVLLIGASVLSIVTYIIRFYTHNDDTTINLTTAYILLPVVFFMAIFAFYQERRTMNTVNTNETQLSKNSTVLRDCRAMVIPTDHLVIGDLVFIFSGQKIPADIRVLQSNSLKIDNSAIKGKSDPQEFTSQTADRNTSVFDSKNVAFQGTYCTEGDGIGLVIRTGKFTFLGNMSEVKFVAETKSLLRKDIKQTVDIISKIAIFMAILFFLVGIAMNGFKNILYYFIVGFLIIIVANVPQGLAPAIMSYLAIIAKRLRRKAIMIKNLDTIDELGAATVLATCKAGILTQNCLTVTDVWYNKKNLKVGRDPAKVHKRIQKQVEESKTREALHQIIGICSRVWRHNTNQSVRRARAASIAAARRESSFQLGAPRKKLFTVVHECGYESIRRPDDYEKRPSILTDNTSSKSSSINELNLLELGEDLKTQVNTLTNATTSATLDCQHKNSTDLAMQNYLISVNYPMEHLKRYYKPIYEIPYSSMRRYQLVICKCLSRINSPLFPTDELEEDQAVYVCMIKGAPEVVLKQSTKYFTDKDGIQEIDEDFEKECEKIWENYSLNGKRTISYALKYFVADKNQKFSAADPNFPSTEMIFLGLGAFFDPPRADSVESIQACKDAGLKIYMITGDHPATSLAVACQIGLVDEKIDKIPRIHTQAMFTIQTGRNWAVVTGKILQTMNQNEWDELLTKPYIIFARTTSEEVMQIVEACQARGEIIALVAGSVNDAASLATSNIGITSNQTGTDIAIKAADIVLNEDGLSIIVQGIEAGRILFENLQLSIAYTLAHLWPEVFPIILNFTVGLPLGLDPMQILSIDLACELPPAIALAYEKPESDLMKCPPRQKQQRLVTIPLLVYSYFFIGSIISTGCLVAYFSVYYYNEVQLEQILFNANDFWHGNANNLTVGSMGKILDSNDQMRIRGQAAAAYQIVLVVSQVFHLFTCTTRRVSLLKHGIVSMAVGLAIVLELFLLFAFIYLSFFQSLLGITTPPSFVWGLGIGTGVFIVIFSEFRKFLLRCSSKNKFISLIEW